MKASRGLLMLALIPLIGGCGGSTGPSLTGALVTKVDAEKSPQSRIAAVDPEFSATAHTVDPAPTIDGKLDDAAWQHATTLQPLLFIDGSGEPKQGGSVLVAATHDDLVIGFTCQESKMSALKPGHKGKDAVTAADDYVEAVLDPDSNGESVYRFRVNPAGGTEDARRQGNIWKTSWNGKWDAAASVNEKDWKAEISVPYTTLGLPGLVKGQQMRVNFIRREQASGERTAWVPSGTPDAEAKFGRLILDHPTYIIEQLDLGAVGYGRNLMDLSIRNRSGQTGPVTVEMRVTGEGAEPSVEKASVLIDPGQDRKLSMVFRVAQRQGTGLATLRLTDPGGTLYHIAEFPIHIARLVELILPRRSYYLGEDAGTAMLRLNVGSESLNGTRVELRLLDAAKAELSNAEIRDPAQESNLVLNLANLAVGNYSLTARLFDRDDKLIGSGAVGLRRLVGPFNEKPKAAPPEKTGSGSASPKPDTSTAKPVSKI